jgi:hypothetical protein
MECKFKGVSRIKLFISGRKDFLYFDLPHNMKVENLKSVIATMYNFDTRLISLYLNNISLDDYKGKTLEQINKGGEISLILTSNKNKKVASNCLDSKTQSRATSPLVTDTSSKLKRSVSNNSTSRNNLHSTTAIKTNYSNCNSSLLFDASLSACSSRSKLTSVTYSSRSLSKSNYIFKKDLELLDKEVEFIKGSIELLQNKMDLGNTYKSGDCRLDRLEILDEVIKEINFNLSRIREMVKTDVENEKNILDRKKENYKSVIDEINRYNEEISKCNFFFEFF